MKKLIFTVSIAILFIVACSGEQNPTPIDQEKVEQQVAKDQAAMDSMEAVIMQQIDSLSDDSL